MNLQYGRETVSGTLNATSVVAQDRGKGIGETKKGVYSLLLESTKNGGLCLRKPIQIYCSDHCDKEGH